MGKLGDTNFQRNGISFGEVAHGREPHALDAEYVSFSPTAAAGNIYTLTHSRGARPGFVQKMHVEHPEHPEYQYAVDGYRRETWDGTKVQVIVTPVGAAVLDGAKVTVMIGGQS